MYIDGFLKSNLDIVKNEAIPNNWDALSIYHGIEGSGKSTLAFQNALYEDPTFNIDKCVFLPKQFEEAIDDAEPESSIVWDEAITGANVMMFASKISISVISKLTQIRKKKLKIKLCFPYLWMLNKYFISRCLYSIHIHAKGFDDRGYFRFFDAKKTQILYYLMKEKNPNYPDNALKKMLPSFHGTFNKEFVLNEAEYDAKKESSRVEGEKENKTNLWKERAYSLIKEHDLSVKDVAKLWGVSAQNVYQLNKQT